MALALGEKAVALRGHRKIRVPRPRSSSRSSTTHERSGFPLLQGLVAGALDVGVVHEDVVALLARNEAEALLSIEELHGTCCQRILFSWHGPTTAVEPENSMLPVIRTRSRVVPRLSLERTAA